MRIYDVLRISIPVDKAPLLLPVSPDPRRRLLVHGRVPVGVEQHQPVAADQVKPAPSRFAAGGEGGTAGRG